MPTLSAADFLRLVENNKTLVFFDLEATGLKGDYNSVICVSIKPYGEKPVTFMIDKAGKDKKVVEQARDMLAKADAWVGYYSKGFDYPMINTRLLKHELEPLQPKPHIDMYYTLRYHLNTARRSQAHLLDWLEIAPTAEALSDLGDGSKVVKKMSVGADEWNKILSGSEKAKKVMRDRCESDTIGLEALYRRTKHLIRDVR